MRIGIYGKNFGSRFDTDIKAIFAYLKQNGFEPVINADFLNYLRVTLDLQGEYSTFSRNHREGLSGVQCMVSIGGDGTFLDAVKYVWEPQIPIFGINTGRLGFLSGVSIDEATSAFEALRSNSLARETRAIIALGMHDNPFATDSFALNEFTVHKQDTSSMITINCFLNGELLNTYWADGLIVSTPTGSTAYSMACGGPIVMPESESFIITPIAPHNLNVRPVVVNSNAHIKLEVSGRTDHCLISLDSRSHIVTHGQEINLSKASKPITLLHLAKNSYVSALRSKLTWGLDNRN